MSLRLRKKAISYEERECMQTLFSKSKKKLLASPLEERGRKKKILWLLPQWKKQNCIAKIPMLHYSITNTR